MVLNQTKQPISLSPCTPAPTSMIEGTQNFTSCVVYVEARFNLRTFISPGFLCSQLTMYHRSYLNTIGLDNDFPVTERSFPKWLVWSQSPRQNENLPVEYKSNVTTYIQCAIQAVHPGTHTAECVRLATGYAKIQGNG